jgi:HK97 family phage major capsid protein
MEFKLKTADELKAMSTEELQDYSVKKAEYELKKWTEMSDKIKSLEENSEEYKKMSGEMKELQKGRLTTLEEALKTQGVLLSKLKDGSLSASTLLEVEGTINGALEKNRENFAKYKDDKKGFEFDLSIKAAGSMTLGGNVSGGTMPQPQRLEGVNDIAERVAVTYSLVPKMTTDRNAIEWVYEANQDGSVTGTAEGTAKDQIDNDFVVTTVSLKKFAAYYNVSTEMLDDVSFMAGWLRNKLIVRLFLAVDNQVLNGDNTGTNLNGVLNQATTWAAGTFADTVDNANDVDSLVVGMNQIKIANQGVSNLTIMMHPSDVTALKMVKMSATDKRYIDRLVTVAGSLMLDGVKIVENNNITVGDFLIGDFSKATIVQKGGITVKVGLNGSDFINNMETILAEWRGQCFIQNNDRTAFVSGTFATTNAALETA